MTKLWVMSDLHLETVPYPESFRPRPPVFDVLVAAGDIVQGDCGRAFRVLRRIAGDMPIVAVLGNHEHWNGILEDNLEAAKRLAPEYGITLLDDELATVCGCAFVGTTLWGDYSLCSAAADPYAETGERFHVRHDGGSHPITVGDAVRLHQEGRERLEQCLATADPSLPLVAVTHHAPHPDCLPRIARGTWAAGNAASDLSAILDQSSIALWVHGHLHNSVDITRGKNRTRIVCNPAGAMFSNVAFDEELVIEV
jgi:Predicted phosphohydrolases